MMGHTNLFTTIIETNGFSSEEKGPKGVYDIATHCQNGRFPVLLSRLKVGS